MPKHERKKIEAIKIIKYWLKLYVMNFYKFMII